MICTPPGAAIVSRGRKVFESRGRTGTVADAMVEGESCLSCYQQFGITRPPASLCSELAMRDGLGITPLTLCVSSRSYVVPQGLVGPGAAASDSDAADPSHTAAEPDTSVTRSPITSRGMQPWVSFSTA